MVHQYSPTEVQVLFNPTPREQISLSKTYSLPTGTLGQFVIEYDVARNGDGGEALVSIRIYIPIIF